MMRTHLAMRSFSRDESVSNTNSRPAPSGRILGYARNYRSLIIGFLVLLVVDSLLVVCAAAAVRRIIDDGITPGNSAVVTMSALMVAGLAVINALVGLVSRWQSARIGEA